MKLIITEKPSVGQAYAKVLGANKREDGYIEGNGYLVSWCVGHLVELSEPESYDEKYKKWNYNDLPIIPANWRYRVSPGTRKQFNVLKTLMHREDVAEVVNCCDAGREGELIFRLVYNECRCKKPMKRLWISSMEDKAIKEGFDNLKAGTEYDSLYEAALCRERADWIVGINATRLFSCLYRQTLNVGRVMTPTLAMVVMREAAIKGFKQEKFYSVQLDLGEFWVGGERMKEREEAEKVAENCRNEGKVRVKTVRQKEKTEKAPLLYDLTSLQRDANRLLGFTAQQTLDYTQSLYEKKMVTYPRTDSRFLTEDMEASVLELHKMIQKEMQGFPKTAMINARQVMNNKKVSDHHAIIPTGSIQADRITELPSGEREVLKLIAIRFFCAVANPCRYQETEIEVKCGDYCFSAKGKTILEKGWKEIQELFYPPKNEKEDTQIPVLEEKQNLSFVSAEVKEGKTTSPKHFTEDTLLSAMETAGADEIPEEAERRGIGTPATRAGIIEKLVQKGYIERSGNCKTKYLVSTHKGDALITVVPEQIQSPLLTAEWEENLLKIEKGQYEKTAFMGEIENMIAKLVSNYEAIKDADTLLPSKEKVIGKCPACGSEVAENRLGWFCRNGECKFALWKNSKFFNKIGKSMTAQIAEKLVKKGSIQLRGCYSQKSGRHYDTLLVLNTDTDGRASFEMKFENGGKK